MGILCCALTPCYEFTMHCKTFLSYTTILTSINFNHTDLKWSGKEMMRFLKFCSYIPRLSFMQENTTRTSIYKTLNDHRTSLFYFHIWSIRLVIWHELTFKELMWTDFMHYYDNNCEMRTTNNIWNGFIRVIRVSETVSDKPCYFASP